MAHQHKPQHTRVQCNRVLEDSLDMLGYSLRTNGIEVNKCLAPDLPEISADADQLHQVFINLIVNAQQALSEQPEPRRLRLSSSDDPVTQEIFVEVADNGPGIPEAIRSRIFDPYFTTKPIGSGTGVGLAVSLGIVEAHGGSLTVSCPPEGGAVFAVRLKVQASINPAIGTEAARFDQPHTRPSRILIVDDEPEVAFVLKDILSNEWREIDTAGSGREALSLLTETGHYDAILSDLRMPDLDGPALYREIQRRWPQLAARVLFVTGDTLNPNVGAFLETCQRPLIEKPFVPSVVRQKITEMENARQIIQ